MSRVQLKHLIAAAALASAPVFGSEIDEPLKVNTDGLQSHVAEQVQQAAAESQRALMQYMWFTRRLHHLWIDDVTTPKDESVAKSEPREKREKREYVVIRSYGAR